PSPFGPLLRCSLDLPAGVLTDRVGGMRGPALLEGGRGFGDAGRWSILAADPIGGIRGTLGPDRWRSRLPGRADREDDGRFRDRGPEESGEGNPLVALADFLKRFGLDRRGDPDAAFGDDVPPFLGGLIGFYSYDLAPSLEHLPRKAPRDSR